MIATAAVLAITLLVLIPRFTGREHTVVAYLRLSDRDEGTAQERAKLLTLEQELAKTLRQSRAGAFRREQVAGGWCLLHMHGPDADRISAVAFPVLQRVHARSGSFIVKRYGKYGAKEREDPL
jgi:hypothetical protein